MRYLAIAFLTLALPFAVSAAVLFDNTTNTGLTVSAPNRIDTTTGLSITTWMFVKSLGGGSGGRILQNGTNGSDGYSFFLGANNILDFGYAAIGAPVTSLNNIFLLGQWQCVGVTFNADSTSIVFYVNGMQQAGGTGGAGNINASTAAPVIGNRSAGDRAFDGYLQNMKIWKRTLTPAEMRSQCYSFFPSAAGLMAWFPLLGVGPVENDWGPRRLLATSTQPAIKNGAHRGAPISLW